MYRILLSWRNKRNNGVGFAGWSISEYFGLLCSSLNLFMREISPSRIIVKWVVQLIPQCSNHSPVDDATKWSAQLKSDVKES